MFSFFSLLVYFSQSHALLFMLLQICQGIVPHITETQNGKFRKSVETWSEHQCVTVYPSGSLEFSLLPLLTSFYIWVPFQILKEESKAHPLGICIKVHHMTDSKSSPNHFQMWTHLSNTHSVLSDGTAIIGKVLLEVRCVSDKEPWAWSKSEMCRHPEVW